MKRHAAIPQTQQFPTDKTIARKIGEGAGDAGVPPCIKRRIAQSPADNHPQRAIEKQIIGMALRHRCAGLLEHFRGMPIGKDHPDQICQRIESQRKKPQIDPRPQAQFGPVDRIGSAAYGK